MWWKSLKVTEEKVIPCIQIKCYIHFSDIHNLLLFQQKKPGFTGVNFFPGLFFVAVWFGCYSWALSLWVGSEPCSEPFCEHMCPSVCISCTSHPGAWLSQQERFIREQHGSTQACTPRSASPRFSPWGLPNLCSKTFLEGYSHPF